MLGQFVIYMEKDKSRSHKQKIIPGLRDLTGKELNYETFLNVGEHSYNPRKRKKKFDKVQKTKCQKKKKISLRL